MGTISVSPNTIVPTLQRGSAWRDAPRHTSPPHHTSSSGRRASRNACPRGAWAR
ncbi:DUF1534 domain-containing protein [Pseudomonas syringae]|nr:DUF1534 domain-containing protein [Pseudomonas syringae]MCF5475587.1 DUF1534 domain-containing protein [Pseudomonas syringae]MCF5485479.1 DUF1534 domain-containing protein [Pseudomonas syringae]MCF5489923.1 DUF1534 domain-containing protein [Pseudomonas syringae]MCF5527274.1 DUF1534 domain-containing protein [Pseudomonas syringae]